MTLRSQRNARAAANWQVTQALATETVLRGKKAPLANEETISRDAQGSMMMEATPTPPLKVVEAQFLLELLVVPFDPPAHLGGADQVDQGGRRRQVDSQYLLGSFFPSGHSISSHSSACGSARGSRGRRPHPTAAKRPSSSPLLPSRQLTVCQALAAG